MGQAPRNPPEDLDLRAAAAALARISHEIKTPLVTIKGYAELLLDQQRQPLCPELRDWVRRIAAGANRLDALFRKILEEERSGSSWTYHPRPVLPEAWLRRCVEEARSLAASRSLRWEWRVTPGTPAVLLDLEAGHDLLLELLQNAARATPDGGAVRAEASLAERAGRRGVLVSVADTGVGVPAGEAADDLFERFVVLGALEGHRSGGFEYQAAGLGVGLSLVKRTARGHGGDAWAEGRGRDEERLPGAIFRVWLPAADVPPSATEDAVPGAVPRGRLLVADPDPEARRILSEALSEAYEVVAVGSGSEALAEWEREGVSWEGCIFDPRLPDLGGVELVQALRSGRRSESAVLLVYAGSEAACTFEALRSAGADACLWKPARSRVLLQRLRFLRRAKGRGQVSDHGTRGDGTIR